MQVSDHRPSGEGKIEVNMAPLIDVSLVLVVILLLATPLAFESSIAVRQAAVSGKTAIEESKKERIEIDILSDEVLVINRERVPYESLEKVLTPLLASSSEHQVVVTCEDAVSHGRFVSVLDQAKLCGAQKIAVKE
jgi:biopolymer transport protein ExbD